MSFLSTITLTTSCIIIYSYEEGGHDFKTTRKTYHQLMASCSATITVSATYHPYLK